MHRNTPYAKYMIAWIDCLNHPLSSAMQEIYQVLKGFWLQTGPAFEQSEMYEKLWGPLDSEGTTYNLSSKDVLVVRMLICLACTNEKDCDELEDMGFFDDLLDNYGISRQQINETSPNKLPNTF